VLLMAVCTGLSVASVYYSQPLLAEIRRSLHMSTGTAGLIVSVTQVGYIAGLSLLVPLGDLFARRRLIPLMLAGAAACLALIAVAPSPAVLLVGCVLVGSLSVGAQITVALAATLAPEEQRGQVVGTIMSGLLLGILLARTAAGYLAQLGGWRTPYWTAAGVMLLLSWVMLAKLPADPSRPSLRYSQLLASTVSILREERVLRLRSAYGALAFAAFSVLWTPLAFMLSSAPYHYSAGTIGLFGLLGVAGALSASFAGRFADRGRAGLMTGVTAVVLLASWALIALGRHSLPLLIGGVIALDFATQGLHITNQSQIYRLRPEARSRITSAYMSLYFLGGVAGSVSAADAYARGGWAAVSVVGAAFSATAVLLWGVATTTATRSPNATRPIRAALIGEKCPRTEGR
jgi:predicted MFS family arabinose efflux permease